MTTVTSSTSIQSTGALQRFAPFIRWVPRVIALAWAAWCLFFGITLLWETTSSYMAEEFGYTPAWYYVAAAGAFIAVAGAIVALFSQLAGGVVMAVSALVAAVAGFVLYPEVNRQLINPNPSNFDLLDSGAPIVIAVLLIGSALLLRRGTEDAR